MLKYIFSNSISVFQAISYIGIAGFISGQESSIIHLVIGLLLFFVLTGVQLRMNKKIKEES